MMPKTALRALLATAATGLLAAACSWSFSPQKSDLKMASQAAKIAGVDDAANRHAPLILVPQKPATTRQPAGVPVVKAPSTTAAVPVAKPAPSASAAAQTMAPLMAGPATTPRITTTKKTITGEKAVTKPP